MFQYPFHHPVVDGSHPSVRLSYAEGESKPFLDVIFLYVRPPRGDVCMLQAETTTTVKGLKEKLLGIVYSYDERYEIISLYLGAVHLADDEQMLSHYGVQSGSTLRIVPRFRAWSQHHPSAQSYQVFGRTLTDRTVTVEAASDDTGSELQMKFWFQAGVNPLESQRIIFAGRPVDLGTKTTLQEYGIMRECTVHLCLNLRGAGLSFTLPRAFAVVLFSWTGDMQYPGLSGLPLERGELLICHTVVCDGWIYCKNKSGKDSFVPVTHVAFLRIFERALHEELCATCGEDTFIPEVSPPPVADKANETRDIEESQTSGHHVQQPGATSAPTKKLLRKWPWLSSDRKTKEKTKTSSITPLSRSYHKGEYYDVWEPCLLPSFNLPAVLAASENLINNPPPLPPFPYPDLDPPIVIRHTLDNNYGSVIAIEVSCSRLNASNGTSPKVMAIVKAIAHRPSRITSVAISFQVEGNQIVSISPREHLGSETKTETNEKVSKVSAMHAGIDVKGLSLGARRGQEIETENSSKQITRQSVKGITIGHQEARWIIEEDGNDASGSGIPRETVLEMGLRLKPRTMLCSYTITACEANGSKKVFSEEERVLEL